MQFLISIRRGSPSHAIGRARNLSQVRLEGLLFKFNGRMQLYQSEVLDDLKAEIKNHPHLHIACLVPVAVPSLPEVEDVEEEEEVEAEVRRPQKAVVKQKPPATSRSAAAALKP